MLKFVFIVLSFILLLPVIYKLITWVFHKIKNEYIDQSLEEREKEIRNSSENFNEALNTAKKKNKEEADRLRKLKNK